MKQTHRHFHGSESRFTYNSNYVLHYEICYRYCGPLKGHDYFWDGIPRQEENSSMVYVSTEKIFYCTFRSHVVSLGSGKLKVDVFNTNFRGGNFSLGHLYYILYGRFSEKCF